ncbi:MAG: hypothetical protein AAB426_01950 [Myxococcota bacterium]
MRLTPRHTPALLLALSTMIALATPHAVQATPPPLVTFQGYLTDDAGVPIDGPVTVHLKLFDVATGGTALFSETQDVDAQRGTVTVQLGAVTSLDLALFRDHETLYLGITVDGNVEMTPRLQLTSSPYAAAAASAVDASTLQGLTPQSLRTSATPLSTNVVYDSASTGLTTSAGQPAASAQQAIDALLGRIQALESQLAAMQATVSQVQQSVATNGASIAVLDGDAQAQDMRVAALESLDAGTRLASVETKTAAISATTVDGYASVLFENVNVHVRRGGLTNTPNGLGNLIVGYNGPRPDGTFDHSGSHNIVVGGQNNYSSYGGIISGEKNAISGPYATAIGGWYNVASADHAAAIGGIQNQATATGAVTSGGVLNKATAAYAVVSGGYGGTASGGSAAVSGGRYGSASGGYSSVTGGYGNTAAADSSSIGGGVSNNASGVYSSIFGGAAVTISGNAQWAGGYLRQVDIDGIPAVLVTYANLHVQSAVGVNHAPNGRGNVIIGYNGLRNDGTDVRTGSHNLIIGAAHSYSSYNGIASGGGHDLLAPYSALIGGGANKALTYQNVVIGGNHNTASGNYAAVIGGTANVASGELATVCGGQSNEASGVRSAISGGWFGVASGAFSSVTGGYANRASGESASVTGGEANRAEGMRSVVSAGAYRVAQNAYDWVAGLLFEDQ